MKIKKWNTGFSKIKIFRDSQNLGGQIGPISDSDFLDLEPFKFKIFGPICLGLDYFGGFLHTLFTHSTLVLTSSELLEYFIVASSNARY